MNHVPVLLQQVVESLNLEKGRDIIDGTINGGGHAQAIIPKIMPGGMFVGIDLDSDILKETAETLKKKFSEYESSLKFINSNYKDINLLVAEGKISKPDGVLLDLGFSSFHIEESGRGFSFQKDEILDMRYSRESGVSAYEVINGSDEKTLADIIWRYGEERFSRKITKAIIESRKKEKIRTTFQLAEIIKKAVPAFYRRNRINPATKTFQALRIYVNNELGNLKSFLETIQKIMRKGGRVAIISFHSLEDRIVKNSFKKMADSEKAKIITKKPVVASRDEIERNPRSRSAKLRVMEII